MQRMLPFLMQAYIKLSILAILLFSTAVFSPHAGEVFMDFIFANMPIFLGVLMAMIAGAQMCYVLMHGHMPLSRHLQWCTVGLLVVLSFYGLLFLGVAISLGQFSLWGQIGSFENATAMMLLYTLGVVITLGASTWLSKRVLVGISS